MRIAIYNGNDSNDNHDICNNDRRTKKKTTTKRQKKKKKQKKQWQKNEENIRSNMNTENDEGKMNNE